MDQLPFTIGGFVKKNKGRGRKLGFPTANLEITANIPEGIFVGYTKFKEKMHPSLIFIGAPITFKEFDKKAEIYILDYDEKIYDEFIEVIAEKKLRDNMLFENKEELIKQMEKDEHHARKYFSRIKI